MTTGGIILMASILTILAVFSATLAWGAHQTKVALRERADAKAAEEASQKPGPAERVLRAA